MADSIQQLYDAIQKERRRNGAGSRTAKLLRDGTTKIAKKLAEEAVEVGHEAILRNKATTIEESADVLYNLAVLWVDAGVKPADVWAEMARRVEMMGIAEKLPKSGTGATKPQKPALSPEAEDGPRPKAGLRLAARWLRLGHRRTSF